MTTKAKKIMDTRGREIFSSSLPHPLTSSLSSRGQGITEYTVLIAVLIAALIGMMSYTQRSLMGKWREAGDTFGAGRQYEPGVTSVTTVRR